jgi:hypothetical protein
VTLKFFAIITVLFCNQVFPFHPNGNQVLKVTDINNELVTGAKVEIPGTSYVYYTNIRGECYIPSNILNRFESLSIYCISYKTLHINVRDMSSKVTLEFR